MFVNLVSIDDNKTYSERAYDSSQVTPELAEQVIRGLDGHRHTLVTLHGNGEQHMAIGGSADGGLVVYATEDNETFRNLLSSRPATGGEPVAIVAGGQPGTYDRKYVVDIESAVAAARAYVTDGSLAEGLEWEVL